MPKKIAKKFLLIIFDWVIPRRASHAVDHDALGVLSPHRNKLSLISTLGATDPREMSGEQSGASNKKMLVLVQSQKHVLSFKYRVGYLTS